MYFQKRLELLMVKPLMPMSTPGLSDFMPTKDVEEYQYAEERSFPLIISLLQHIALKVVQFRLFYTFIIYILKSRRNHPMRKYGRSWFVARRWNYRYVGGSTVSTLFENYSKCRIWIFLILAFFINFCTNKIDLSGNTFWPQALGFHKLAKIDYFWLF